MTLPSYFISCDWGTTNFRLRLVETAELVVIAEYHTDQGVKALNQKFLLQEEVDRKSFFTKYLCEQIENLPKAHRHHLIISSGMSTSNIGLLELDYVDLPFDRNGDSLKFETVSIRENQKMLLISGVKGQTGMMRGEEVQAIGLDTLIKSSVGGILILPGTHSKHITFDKERFYDLKNYMTGELFDILTKKSILANSVEAGANLPEYVTSFMEGVQLGLKGELAQNLFYIRARDVLTKKSKRGNYLMLSGLLIGDELSYLKNSGKKVFFAAPAGIFEFYKTALQSFLKKQQLECFDDSILEKALLTGQRQILLRSIS